MDGDSIDKIYKGPDGAALRFSWKPQKNNFVSEREGRAVYDKCLMVEIITPGSNESMPLVELERHFCEESGITAPRLNAAKLAQYAEATAAFKAGEYDAALQGTPLTEWPPIDVALAETLKGLRIFTVEQLADVSDTHLPKLGTGGRVLREQAKTFVATKLTGGGANAELSAAVANQATEIERLKGELAAMNDKMTAQEAELNAFRTAPVPQPEQPVDPLAGKPGKVKGANAPIV